jgi:mercuric ion binding protein
MKKIITTLLLALFTSISLWAGDKIRTTAIQSKILCDHCRQCGSCGDRLEKALYAQKGIKRVDIDEKTMKIKVSYNTAKISIEEIRKTIAGCGFDADETKAVPEAVAKLDGCCRGEEE